VTERTAVQLRPIRL